MRYRGTVRGKVIELEEDVSLAEGLTVQVLVPGMEAPADTPELSALARSAGEGEQEFAQEARFLMALRLFERRLVSAGKAAQLSGLSKPDFLLEASRRSVPVVDLDEDQLDAEFASA